MSDSNTPASGSGEPPVPPVTPPESSGHPEAPVGGYQSAPPPAYQAPQPPQGYQAPPAPGYQAPPVQGYGQGQPGYGQAQQGYGQTPPPGYPPQQQPNYGAYQAPTAPPMNTLAIITIILAFVFSVAGIVTGHIALKQIDRTGESGRGLAKAGLILSYVFTGLWVLGIIAYIVFIVLAIAFASSSGYGYTY